MFEKVVIATDFSPAAKRAEKIVSELSSHAGKIVLASVVDEGETEEDVTLIVLGMRSKGGVEGLVLGYTAEK